MNYTAGSDFGPGWLWSFSTLHLQKQRGDALSMSAFSLQSLNFFTQSGCTITYDAIC